MPDHDTVYIDYDENRFTDIRTNSLGYNNKYSAFSNHTYENVRSFNLQMKITCESYRRGMDYFIEIVGLLLRDIL